MDIAEVVRRTNVAASTLRFYEKKGLIRAARSAGGRRDFPPRVFDQLALIALGQAGGLSLDEIGAMLSPEGAARVDRALLLAKAEEIDATVKRLRAMSQGLRHAAACPASSHTDCPTFQRLLKAAASGRLKPREKKEDRRLDQLQPLRSSRSPAGGRSEGSAKRTRLPL